MQRHGDRDRHVSDHGRLDGDGRFHHIGRVFLRRVGHHNSDLDGEAATVTIYPVNLQPLTVDAGPQPQAFTARNEAFTSVTVCVPGTNTCQTIDHILVDTGSSGLRLLSSVLTIPLPPQNDSSGNPLDECPLILRGYAWGPVALADILLAGEKASSLLCR